jgi:hypothetical protein
MQMRTLASMPCEIVSMLRFIAWKSLSRELGLTTSAISYTIKRMEAGLDVVLFTRNTRSIERAAVVNASRFSSVKIEFMRPSRLR